MTLTLKGVLLYVAALLFLIMLVICSQALMGQQTLPGPYITANGVVSQTDLTVMSGENRLVTFTTTHDIYIHGKDGGAFVIKANGLTETVGPPTIKPDEAALQFYKALSILAASNWDCAHQR